MKEIKSNITSAKILKGDNAAEQASTEAVKPEADKLNENIQRPEMLIGSTYKIKPPISEHALYITINDILLNPDTEDEQRSPFEIFVNSKNMEFYAWVVAMTRVISAVFRKGGDCTFLVEELKAVFDPKGGYYQRGTGVYMPSVVAEIGHVIERHLKAINILPADDIDVHQQAYLKNKLEELKGKSDTMDTSQFPATASHCNKCNQKAVILLDGCSTCLNCADSKCG